MIYCLRNTKYKIFKSSDLDMICISKLGGIEIKKFITKYGHALTAFAFVVTALSANTRCYFIYHQPKFPDAAKKLRKF